MFHCKDKPLIKLKINGTKINSIKFMNVLGVHFDSKLNGQIHIQNAISKSKKALQAIKINKELFSKQELMSLVTANYYSILFHSSEIWLIPSLTCQMKTQLMSAYLNYIALPMNFQSHLNASIH